METKAKYETWKCGCCGVVLGIVEEGKVIRIKRKDLYVTVEGGKLTVNCTKCGKPNVLEDKQATTVIDIKG
jgi:hypothetical protein